MSDACEVDGCHAFAWRTLFGDKLRSLCAAHRREPRARWWETVPRAVGWIARVRERGLPW